MNKTQNYQLSLWEKADRLLMANFNEDNGKIDTALASLQSQLNSKTDTGTTSALQARVQVGYGSYTGNGSTSRTISLGYTPLAVLLVTYRGDMRQGSTTYGGLALQSSPARSLDGQNIATIEAGGFRVGYAGDGQSNASGTTYHYLTFYQS